MGCRYSYSWLVSTMNLQVHEESQASADSSSTLPGGGGGGYMHTVVAKVV